MMGIRPLCSPGLQIAYVMGLVETHVQLLAFYSRSLASGHFVFRREIARRDLIL